MQIGDKLKSAREEHKLTQSQASEQFMVSRQTISNWETGKSLPDMSLPDILSVIRMSEFYQISLDELLKGDQAMLKNMEQEAEQRKAEKTVLKVAWGSISVGILVLILGQVFGGAPAVEFLSGATPWVLLGVTFLLWMLSLNRQSKKHQE